MGCRLCSESCVKVGVMIRLTERLSLTEVCSHPYCVNTKELFFHQVISLPHKIVVKRYLPVVTFWQEGKLGKQINLERSANPL